MIIDHLIRWAELNIARVRACACAYVRALQNYRLPPIPKAECEVGSQWNPLNNTRVHRYLYSLPILLEVMCDLPAMFINSGEKVSGWRTVGKRGCARRVVLARCIWRCNGWYRLTTADGRNGCETQSWRIMVGLIRLMHVLCSHTQVMTAHIISLSTRKVTSRLYLASSSLDLRLWHSSATISPNVGHLMFHVPMNVPSSNFISAFVPVALFF